MKQIILAAITLIGSATASSASMDWASEKQIAVTAKLATAFASTEMCDVDIDPDRVASIVQTTFGDRLSAKQFADVLYQVGVIRAIQGVQIKGLKPSELQDRCQAYQKLYGSKGTDFRGLLR